MRRPIKGKGTISLPWTSACTTSQDCTFQQLAPYIGRMKTSIARHLVERFTSRGDVIIDPFAGSGVIPFEASLLGRLTVASDTNPYGVLLMRAKFTAPRQLDHAVKRFEIRWKSARKRIPAQDLRSVPLWVRRFFHPETLRKTLALRDELVAESDHFLMACLLGILHHQRPGFLSYPRSHLVPYLRDKLFPKQMFPGLYEERDIWIRMVAKIQRTYRRPPVARTRARTYLSDARRLALPSSINAVITSPPYMNELDYIRDNRLRLWFLERDLPSIPDIKRRDRVHRFRDLLRDTFTRVVPHLARRSPIVLVVGDTSRGSHRVDAAQIVRDVFSEPVFRSLIPLEEIEDTIPDIRRSRRDLAGTKKETILCYVAKG